MSNENSFICELCLKYLRTKSLSTKKSTKRTWAGVRTPKRLSHSSPNPKRSDLRDTPTRLIGSPTPTYKINTAEESLSLSGVTTPVPTCSRILPTYQIARAEHRLSGFTPITTQTSYKQHIDHHNVSDACTQETPEINPMASKGHWKLSVAKYIQQR